MSRVSFYTRPYDRLEPYDGKLSRTVLRGGAGSNASLLPDALPIYFLHKVKGLLVNDSFKDVYGWGSSTICNILEKREYLGHTINFKKSMHYNPFAYIHSEKDILKLVTTLIANTKGEGKAGDDFWVKAETLLYCALIGYIHYEAPVEEQNFSTLIEFINAMEVREDDEEFKNPVDLMFDALVDQTAHMNRQSAVVHIVGLFAEQVKQLGITHGYKEIKAVISVTHDEEQGSFPVSQSILLQLIISRGRETSHSLNYQKLGKELMSQDELAVMDGGKGILQLRGVRPFLSDKYDITKHPNFKYTADADDKNAFDIEAFLSARLKLKPNEVCDVYEVDTKGA